MKRFIKIMFILLLLLFLFGYYYPVKVAVDKEDISSVNGDYVIIEHVKTTGFDWQVVESSIGYSNCYIEFEGPIEDEIRDLKDMSIVSVRGYNQYVLYGEFIEERISYDTFCIGFKATGWDVIDPVKRDYNFFRPSYGLTWFDFE